MVEDTSGIFKPEAKTVMKLFGDADSYYQIPDYQRPYSWGNQHLDQLWDDVSSALDAGNESYFLGPIILTKTQSGYFEVVDGQQRLTTLTILFSVIRDLYAGELEPLDKELVNSIRDAVKSLVKGKHRLKLITQLHYQNQFEQEILNGVKFPQVMLTKKEREEKKFINAALTFRDRLDALKNNKGIEAIRIFTDYLLNKVEMIAIVCSRQEYAIKLFQVLNTRGMDLSHADLVKSHLYGKLVDETKKQQFMATWRDIETLSKEADEDITDLLTCYEYYLLASNPRRSLYEELMDQFKGKEPNEVVYDFKEFVECFGDISGQQSKLVYSFWYLPNQVFWKAILTSAKKEGFRDFVGLCKELKKVYYSYWIAGYSTSKIKQLSFNLIDWVKAGKTLHAIKNKLDRKMEEDGVLGRIKESLEGEVYGDPWLKPILTLVEYEQTDDSKIAFVDLDRNIHIDHILPQEGQKIPDWRRLWSKAKAEHWLDRLGNLTLLSGRKNIRASNKPFDEKKSIYCGKGLDGTTGFLISQRVIKEKTWTERRVIERKDWLIGQIGNALGIVLSESEVVSKNWTGG